ncbi:hypothetical protein DFJ74DRAFT_663095 [Hyaloraphidium curvatum]|nr:hypothetical protein DFJ74DRAFT_663095 [Hyaloraphidium curvatum]
MLRASQLLLAALLFLGLASPGLAWSNWKCVQACPLSGRDTGSILVRSEGRRVMCDGPDSDSCYWYLDETCNGYVGMARLPRPDEPGHECTSEEKKDKEHWCYEAKRILVWKRAPRCYVGQPGRIA